MSRPRLPGSVEAKVLTFSRRRCCICFGLEGDFSRKKGQIAHLDNDPANNDLENLAFLCLDHHDEYDSRTSQAKGLREREVKVYRESLYEAVRQYFEPTSIPEAPASEIDERVDAEDILLAKGEFDFYLAQYKEYEREGTNALRDMSQVVGDLSETMRRSSEKVSKLLAAAPSKRDFNAYYRERARELITFSDDLSEGTRRFSLLTSKMLDALSRASAAASDYEGVTPEMFERKISGLQSMREALEQSLRSAGGVRDAIREWPRGTNEFNRGRRLALGALDNYLAEVERKIQDTRTREERIRKLVELL